MSSTRGIYSALSGAMAQAERLDTISNNIANVNTPGFKRDEQVFQEYLTIAEKPEQALLTTEIPATMESFYDMQGADTSFVDKQGTWTDHSQGRLITTGNPMDVALDGEGFFEVMTPQGLQLTRQGGFTVDGNGQIVTKEGYIVMADAAPGVDPADRVLRTDGQNGSLRISEGGEVYEGQNLIGRLSVVNVANKDALSKTGGGFFTFKANQPRETIAIANPNLRQGCIEGSNVNIVKEMTDMISATRVFETSKKAIDAYDSMNDKAVNQIPRIG